MPRKKNQFLKPRTFEIEGWEFPQYGSLRVYERDYLLSRQQERNDHWALMVGVAEKLAKEKGLEVESAFDMLRKGEFSEVELAQFQHEVDKIKESSGEDGIRDQVSLLLRSRLSADFLKANREALQESYGLELGDVDISEFADTPQLKRLESKYLETVTETIIMVLPGSTYFGMAEFIDMEIEGVDSPEELQALMAKRNEEAEATAPKTQESSLASDEEE